MSRPPKPYLVLKSEKKSHRTKKELKIREDGEKSLSTGIPLKARNQVKNNPIAYKEFKRINSLLKKIDKNDAIYELVINRFCLITAECEELEKRRERIYNIIDEMGELFEECLETVDAEERAKMMFKFAKEINQLTSTMMDIDKILQSKRKMLLDIEKENVMTIAAALRNIPKQEENKASALLEALNAD